MALFTGDSGILLGYQIALQVDGKLIGYGTSISIDDTTETIDVSNRESGNYGSVKPGRSSYSISFEGYNGYNGEGFFNLKTVKDTKLPIEWFLVPQKDAVSQMDSTGDVATGITATNMYHKGTAYITSLSASYGDQDASTYSASLEGVGALEAAVYTEVEYTIATGIVVQA
jgi:hypothetical protein